MSKEKSTSLEKQLKSIKVSKIMSKFAITATELTVITDVAHLMLRFKISGVPIKDEYEEVIGVVTATDLFDLIGRTNQEIGQNEDLTDYSQMPVKEVMTTDVFTIDEQMSLYDVIVTMRDRKIHTLPVLSDEGVLIGVVGRRDVINAYYSLSQKSKNS